MTRKLRRNYSLRVVVPFIAVLILSVAFVALAQMPGASQWSAQNEIVAAQLAPAVQNPPLKFAKAVTYYSGGAYSQELAVGDLNGDGKPDLVVGNNDSNTVGVLLGNGDGTFQAAVTYNSGGSTPSWVALADLRGYGILDLVVANYASNTVSVLLGNGDGTFQAPVSYSSGGVDPRSVAVSDLNGDGILDLVVANLCESASCDYGVVGVLLGNGDGTFQAPVSYYSGGYDAVSVAIGDLNGDGKPDVVVANGNDDSDSVGVLMGNGDGTFQPVVTYGSGGDSPNSVAIASLRGDGILDVVVANINNSTVGVLLGNGDGTFQPAVSYEPGGLYTISVAIADVNGDGKPDVLTSSECPQPKPGQGGCSGWPGSGLGAVGVLLGNGDGTFQAPVSYKSGGYDAEAVAAADVNGDGRPDLVVLSGCAGKNCSNANGEVGVLLNETPWATTTTVTSSPNPSQVGQTVTFTATVSSTQPIPDGQIVTFSTGKTELGTSTTTNGVATLNTSFSKAKTYPIKASYPGGGFFAASSGTMQQVVEK